MPIVDLHVRSTDRSGLDPDLNVSQTRPCSEGPWLVDGTGTRNSLENCVHLVFQTIPLNCSPAFRPSVKRYCQSRCTRNGSYRVKHFTQVRSTGIRNEPAIRYAKRTSA